MRLSVIIVNFNSISYLKDCLFNLQNLNLPFSFETLVVDNGSKDGSQAWLKTQFQGTYILSLENLGFAKGNNLALKEAEGEYILLLNTDAFPERGAIERLINVLEAKNQAGIAGPQLKFPNGRWQRGYNAIPTITRARMGLILDVYNLLYPQIAPVINKLNLARPRNVGYVDGCCMMIKREVLENIGLLDESFFFFGEDVEFCYRAKQRGYGVYYVPEAKVMHARGGSSAQKDLGRAVKLRRDAEKLFISRTFGKDAWKQYSRIMYRNFSIRYHIARLFNRSSQNYFLCALKEFRRRD